MVKAPVDLLWLLRDAEIFCPPAGWCCEPATLLKPKHTWLTFATGTGLDADMVVAADPRKPIRREDFGRKEAGERRVDVAAKGLAGAGVGTTQRTRRRKQKRARI